MRPLEECRLGDWVGQASDDSNLEFRQAVHTVLAAIAGEEQLQANMVLKGGILLAVRYQSHRYTRDIDFSTLLTIGDGLEPDQVVRAVNASLAHVVEKLDYDLDCRVQTWEVQPKHLTEASYPTMKLRIGHAYKGTAKHRRLLASQSPTTITLDYSLNEALPNVDNVSLGEDGDLQVYSFTDLVAEKFRALLQQASRNRTRRQDIFDLHLLLEHCEPLDDAEKNAILTSLIVKSQARNINPTIAAMDDEELRARAERDYDTLASEIEGELPPFDDAYDIARRFYRALPWDS
jgi:predicted nucleotidyltransferase component of viral defense system